MILLLLLGYIIISILCYICCFIWHCWNFKNNNTHWNFDGYYNEYFVEMVALSILWPFGIPMLLVILFFQLFSKITKKAETIIKSKFKL